MGWYYRLSRKDVLDRLLDGVKQMLVDDSEGWSQFGIACQMVPGATYFYDKTPEGLMRMTTVFYDAKSILIMLRVDRNKIDLYWKSPTVFRVGQIRRTRWNLELKWSLILRKKEIEIPIDFFSLVPKHCLKDII